MATALQQQLAVIAANSTHQLDLKAQKARHGKSLLFEPRDAAAQNFDSIYQLCLEGFEELCQLDSRFLPFSRNLFSEQSKNEDRTNMTAQENAELDGVVEKFLGLLGARLLLKPAMKAMEWLVRRFRVQEYSTEVVLFTFLPYHSSHIFPTLMSILPEQLPPTFRFLHPYVTSLQNPPRHAIVAAASTHAALFTAYSHHVLKIARARHQSALLLGFWASVTAQAVNGMIDATRSGREAVRRQKEEDLLLKVLPILQSALSLKDVPELYLGSCMIMTIMATKASLSEKVLNAMIEAVAGGWSEQTVEDGLVCLAVLAEEKEHPALPRAAVRALLDQDHILAIIDRIALKCRAERLLTGVALGAMDLILDTQHPCASKVFADSLASTVLPEDHLVFIIESALKTMTDIPAAESKSSGRQELVDVLAQSTAQVRLSKALRTAAARTNIDISQLDASLLLQLQADQLEESDEHQEQMLIDHDISETTIENRALLDKLPKPPTKDTSFLDPDLQELYSEYTLAFQQALPSKNDLAALLGMPALHRKASVENANALSFFAHVWSDDVPVSVRAKALQITRELLELATKSKQTTDMQGLIPYIVSALNDPNKAVRKGAASVCLVLPGLYKVNGSNESLIWAKSAVYGKSSSQVQWMSSADANKFIEDTLLPILEDCVVDQNYINQYLADVISATTRTTTSDRKELKQSLRTSLAEFLASHAVASPVQTLKVRLLNLLGKVGKAAGLARAQIILPYARSFFADHAAQTVPAQYDELCHALIENITARTADELQFLKDVAAGETHPYPVASKLGFGRLRKLWRGMKDATHLELVDWLSNIALDDKVSEEVGTEATETLRSVPLTTPTVVHLVETLPSVAQLQGPVAQSKKQRASRASDLSKLGTVERSKLNGAIRRITLILEVVEGSKPEQHPQLLKSLFYLLSELQSYRILLDSELVYLQGLLINNLLSVVNGFKNVPSKDIDRSVVRADLIVDCVRTTSSTQVHQAALLLMSALASWAPDLVLHSVMPLFTFMSSTILKQGDDYSAHVTDRTVAQIIPPLAASLKTRGRDLITGSAELLLSFTAAFEHIPLHRRGSLFQHLVRTLGAEEALFAIVSMLIERYPEDSSVLAFVVELVDEFPVATQLLAVKQYLELVFDTQKPKRALSDVILGYAEKDKEQAKNATKVLLEGLASFLAQDQMRKRLAKELKNGGKDADELRKTYSTVLEMTMELGLQLKDHGDLQESATNVLTSLLGLMPTSDFIESSAQLMQRGSNEIRQQVFWSLEQRVETARRGDSALQRTFLDVLPGCAVFLTTDQPIETRIAAITCMDRISEKFGKTDRSAVVEAAQAIAGPAGLGESRADIRRISILCLASMVEVLDDEFIPVLPTTFDTVLGYMEETTNQDELDEELIAAGFSFAMSVLDNIPWMLSGKYLDRLLSVAAETNADSVTSFTQLAAKKVSASDFLGSIERTWSSVVQYSISVSCDAVRVHLSALQAAVQQHTKAAVTQNSQLLFNILLQAFDLRRQLDDVDDDDLSRVFSLVNDITLLTVLKLNDTAFRPFFIRLSEWAINTLPQKDKNGIVLRCMSLYSFSRVFFEQLKSLVTSYAGFLLENAASLLENLSPTVQNEPELLNIVIDAFTANFSHDQDGFWQSPAHFDAICKPLISRLSDADRLDTNAYIVPAITELATAVNSPEHHKTINAMVMSYMRHESAAVRLAAVKCERALTDRLHIDWLHSLPEMLPFISELQEDDDGLVERETLRWINQIEEVTGESLDSMLR
jgi:U3 small nucleolar RNA-associated protein 10